MNSLLGCSVSRGSHHLWVGVRVPCPGDPPTYRLPLGEVEIIDLLWSLKLQSASQQAPTLLSCTGKLSEFFSPFNSHRAINKLKLWVSLTPFFIFYFKYNELQTIRALQIITGHGSSPLCCLFVNLKMCPVPSPTGQIKGTPVEGWARHWGCSVIAVPAWFRLMEHVCAAGSYSAGVCGAEVPLPTA
jgi:hypothetical protein